MAAQGETGDGTGDALPSRRMTGPMRPPDANSAAASGEVSDATKAFLAREERMRNGEGAQSSSAGPATARPEWMLAPPSATSIGEMLISDPKAALKSRGFSQSATKRVQHTPSGGGAGAKTDVDSRIWTETPQERATRLQEEQMGVRASAAVESRQGDDDADRQLQAEREREERVRAAVQEHNAARGPTLLEQHQAKRREELKRRDGDDGSGGGSSRRRRSERSDETRRDDEHRSHRHRRPRGSDNEGDEGDSRKGSRQRHRHASVSSDGSRSEDDRRHKSSSRRDERHRSSRHHSEHHRRHRSRSPDARSKSQHDKDRAARREEKERHRERERKKRQREKEERGEKGGAPMMVWDREAAMSVGGKLMDERKRVDVIRSAASLNDRFGQGSSRYM